MRGADDVLRVAGYRARGAGCGLRGTGYEVMAIIRGFNAQRATRNSWPLGNEIFYQYSICAKLRERAA